MSHDALADLHTALIDALDGYDKAIEKSDAAETTALFRQMQGLHRSAHSDIHTVLGAHGLKPDDDGSFMGSVHKAVISVRAAFTGIDAGSLDAFASGEESILKKYDDAIAEEHDASIGAMLRGHREKLAGKIAEMHRMAEAS